MHEMWKRGAEQSRVVKRQKFREEEEEQVNEREKEERR